MHKIKSFLSRKISIKCQYFIYYAMCTVLRAARWANVHSQYSSFHTEFSLTSGSIQRSNSEEYQSIQINLKITGKCNKYFNFVIFTPVSGCEKHSDKSDRQTERRPSVNRAAFPGDNVNLTVNAARCAGRDVKKPSNETEQIHLWTLLRLSKTSCSVIQVLRFPLSKEPCRSWTQ